MATFNRLVSKRLSVIFVLLPFFYGCATDSRYVSVESKFDNKIGHSRSATGTHKVKKGETLYSIAFRYGWDFSQLAKANGIRAPYTIYPGQSLKVAKNRYNRASSPAYPQVADKKLTKKPTSTKKAPKYSQSSGDPGSQRVANSANMAWSWPAKGKVIKHFSTKAPVNKGIDLAGKLGESVRAAAAGTVVYSGNGLRGYGNLVIIKHNTNYLSAYAHNSKILVKEKQEVKANQKIAEIGSSGAEQVKLHFEIRRDGKPVNPLDYLPRS